MPELKLCPFCGGKARIQTSVSSGVPRVMRAMVYCQNCSASTSWFYDNECDGTFLIKSIGAWNRRAKA